MIIFGSFFFFKLKKKTREIAIVLYKLYLGKVYLLFKFIFQNDYLRDVFLLGKVSYDLLEVFMFDDDVLGHF